jgi:hypothetical protein
MEVARQVIDHVERGDRVEAIAELDVEDVAMDQPSARDVAPRPLDLGRGHVDSGRPLALGDRARGGHRVPASNVEHVRSLWDEGEQPREPAHPRPRGFHALERRVPIGDRVVAGFDDAPRVCWLGHRSNEREGRREREEPYPVSCPAA